MRPSKHPRRRRRCAALAVVPAVVATALAAPAAPTAPTAPTASAALAAPAADAAPTAEAAPAADAVPAAARGAEYVPGEVVVGERGGGVEVVEVPRDTDVVAAARALERQPAVRFAEPNWIATAADLPPLDRGSSGKLRGWRADQWNFLGKPGGIRVVGAWRHAERLGAPGGAGVTVAVIDTGVAFAAADGFAPSPDFRHDQFVPGIDILDGDRLPLDENGHGTHVAGTIAEQVTLDEPAAGEDYLTGIAYGAELMPVRVLDAAGKGSASDVARGIRWAVRHGAEILNLSLQFPATVTGCAQIQAVCGAIRAANRRGALVVGAAGNNEAGGVPGALFPAAAPKALAVGATTLHGCLAAYSHFGPHTDLLAPGGGAPRRDAAKPRCAGDSARIRQLTYACFPPLVFCPRHDRFAIRADLGSSMAAAHVSGVAALVRASGLLGPDPSPRRLAKRLRCTARRAKPLRFYRPGLLDAKRALTPRIACALPRRSR